jgi:hypothetical protein
MGMHSGRSAGAPGSLDFERHFALTETEQGDGRG